MEERLTEAAHEVWLKGMKVRLGSYIPNKKIISRRATQLAEITEEAVKTYIDKNNKEVQAGSKVLKGKYILQTPRQEGAIPKVIRNYAKKKKVIIEEVEDVTDKMLRWWGDTP